jgi:hypothetical protein
MESTPDNVFAPVVVVYSLAWPMLLQLKDEKF